MWRMKLMVFLSVVRGVMQPMWVTQVEKPAGELCRDQQSLDERELMIHRSISPGESFLWSSPEDGTTPAINRVTTDPSYNPERAVVGPVHDGVLLLEDVPGSKESPKMEEVVIPGSVVVEVPDLEEEFLEFEEEFPEIEESPPNWLFHISSFIFTLIDFYSIIYWMNLLRKRLIRGWDSNHKRGRKRRNRRRRNKVKP